VVDNRIEAVSLCKISAALDPLVTDKIKAVGESARIKVSAAPKAVLFCFHGFIDQSFGYFGRRPVQSGNHEHAIRRVEKRMIGKSVTRIVKWSHHRQI